MNFTIKMNMKYSRKPESTMLIHDVSSSESLWLEDGWIDPQEAMQINQVDGTFESDQPFVCANQLFEAKFMVFRGSIWHHR